MRIHLSQRLDVTNFCLLVIHGLWPIQIVFIRILSKLLQASVVVMANVNVGLAQLVSDLCERATLKEMQPESLSLVFGQAIPDLLPPVSAEKPFHAIVVV
jgi:hypothetical protein